MYLLAYSYNNFAEAFASKNKDLTSSTSDFSISVLPYV